MALLVAENIEKEFGKGPAAVRVLTGVNFSLEAGRSAAIGGSSGSGKSTLLSLLAGLDRPTAGKIFLDDTPLHESSESRLARTRRDKVGFVFQSFHLVPSLTVLENAQLPAALRGDPHAEEKAMGLLTRLGMANRTHHLPDQLSGGEKQRAALARALVNDPKILFADEPTGNLDSRNGGLVLDLLEEHTRGSGRALVLVTHDPVVAARAQRRLLLRDGVLVDLT